MIFYENGLSAHARDAPAGWWRNMLFLGELDALLAVLGFATDYDVFGQSWSPFGLRRLVMANFPASVPRSTFSGMVFSRQARKNCVARRYGPVTLRGRHESRCEHGIHPFPDY